MSDEPAASDRSPLQQVEQQVLARVKHLAPEDSSVDVALLRRLVEDEVDHWRQEHRRGRRAADLPTGDTLIERAMRNLTGYGPLEPLLADDDVWEIMVNAPTEIFVKRHRGHDGYHDEVFHDDHHVVRVLTKILDDAGASHRKLDPTDGLQDAQLDSGARLHIVHGDVSRGGHTMVNIRKFTG
ncbi:MAG: Flp pilus assembly complex ATPase component TadA, partial [Acidimicrobiales bacterium]|nr:Flp pilus assembly complex ATPase component TadA [Acidimicrobiales bacterium]